MEPWQSWLLALILLGGASAYYGRDTELVQYIRAQLAHTPKPMAVPASARNRSEKKQKVTEKVADVVGSAANVLPNGTTTNQVKNRNIKSSATKAATTPKTSPVSSNVPRATEQEDDDQEWARQLLAAKQGVSLSSANNKQQQSRTSKQQKSTVHDSGATASVTAPTNGTPRAKPSVPETSQAPAQSSATDVSDMLEPQSSGPSVVRITGEQKENKPRTPKVEQGQETKKQRQNRKKVEEKKFMREQEEKERQKLLEQQRRTARESRGEPAKNGLIPAITPAGSTWSAQAQNVKDSVTATVAPLLDTFEHETTSNASSADIQQSSTNSLSNDHSVSSGSMLNGSGEWNEVSTKFKKNKKQTAAPASANVAAMSTSALAPKPSSRYESIPSSELINDKRSSGKMNGSNKAATNGFAALDESTRFTPGTKGHPDDSDWVVA